MQAIDSIHGTDAIAQLGYDSDYIQTYYNKRVV